MQDFSSSRLRKYTNRNAEQLPRASGDAGAWGDLCQRLLAEAHRQMDIAFLGLEDPALVASLRHGLWCSGASAACPALTMQHCQHQTSPHKALSA